MPLPSLRTTSQRGRLIFAVVGALVLALLLASVLRPGLVSDAHGASDKKKSGAAGATVPVRTARVKQENLPITLTGIGTVQAAMSVTVRSRTDGQLDRVNFTEGQDVRAGQLLAQLDPRTSAAQLQQAEAQRSRDVAQLANAEADSKRYGDLVEVQGATRQQFETAQATVRQLQATVQSDEAQINAARVQLSFTSITAPIAGRVGARLVDPGNIVHVSDANGLLVINQIDPIAVVFSLPEGNFQSINDALNRSGTKLAVQALDRDTHEVLADGTLVLLNNQIDASTGTVALKAMFPNPKHRLWPGQSIDARLVLGTHTDALTIPPGAVQRSQTGLFVYVVDDEQTARVKQIKVGPADETRVIVDQGLALNDRVVTDGQFRLLPGSPVTEAPQKSAASKP